MYQRLRRMIKRVFIYTSVILSPAIIWTLSRLIVKHDQEHLIVWAKRSGALLMSPEEGADQWWRVLTGPLLHQGSHHLISNGVMIALSSLILTVIYTRQIEDSIGLPLRQRYYDGLIWIYLTLYIGASLIAISRLCLGHYLGITQGSIGLSGGAFLTLSALCVSVSISPSLIGVIDQSDLTSKRVMSALWVTLPLLLLLLNRGAEVDQWSHIAGWIGGTLWGVFWTCRRKTTEDFIGSHQVIYIILVMTCVCQMIAIFLCLLKS